MANMYVMCGHPASGKSTFAKEYAELVNARYVNIDDCYAVLNGDEKIHENKFEVWQLFYRIIHIAQELNQNIVVDTNAPLVSDRQEFLDWFPQFETHTLIWIDADPELAWKNNCNRERKIPKEDFDRIINLFQPPTSKEPGGRSKWDDIIKIKNKNNHFSDIPEYIRKGEKNEKI